MEIVNGHWWKHRFHLPLIYQFPLLTNFFSDQKFWKKLLQTLTTKQTLDIVQRVARKTDDWKFYGTHTPFWMVGWQKIDGEWERMQEREAIGWLANSLSIIVDDSLLSVRDGLSTGVSVVMENIALQAVGVGGLPPVVLLPLFFFFQNIILYTKKSLSIMFNTFHNKRIASSSSTSRRSTSIGQLCIRRAAVKPPATRPSLFPPQKNICKP